MSLVKKRILKSGSGESPVMCSAGVVIIAVSESQKIMSGVLLEGSKVLEGDIAAGVMDLVAEFKNPPQDLVFKAVGEERYLPWVNAGLKKSFQKELTSYATRPSRFELVLNFSSLKIKVSKPVEGAPRAEKKARVLIVDDSKTIRVLLSKILSEDPGIEVVGAAEKPSQAEQMIRELKPDVITLDIHMPEMTGVDFLKVFLPKFPIPTVMITSLSLEDGPLVLQALENGAVDYIQKPSANQLSDVAPLIIEKVRGAAQGKVKQALSPVRRAPVADVRNMDFNRLMVMGSSTGGTEALRNVLTRMPEKIPPIAIVQHIPPVFSKALANRLNELCPFEVIEARNGDELKPGRVVIAPGGFQMRLKRRSSGVLECVVEDAPPVNRHKPSVDVLFNSVVELGIKKSIGVILTGMGADGAAGLKKMRDIGCRTIAQNEETCVVYGMPREAVARGAAEFVDPLDAIADRMISLSCTPAV